jgi:hypothetical protein
MLYLPKYECRIGLPHFSDKAQIMRWETFIRCLAVQGAPANIVNDFFASLPQPMLPREEHSGMATKKALHCAGHN